jgi:hypothetical protein
MKIYLINVLLGLHTFIGTLFGVPWNVTPSAWAFYWSHHGKKFKLWWVFVAYVADRIFGKGHCRKAFIRARNGCKHYHKKEFRKALKGKLWLP